ncbi:MAG: UDP-N-acetylglucosamine 1-carboxyvinyltransferase [Planctomycetes bacterium]|nr:UDP-N-acetylglucosamine 1-carboxyvinyltransferase [Planctomycetota bacterium]
MEKMVIHGGSPLRGTVAVAGSKNAALPIMAASLLTDEPVTLQNVPDLADVDTLIQVLAGLGVSNVRLPGGTVQLVADDTNRREADPELVSRMRASFCVLGPLVARRGYAKVALPGGCRIGDRPVDLHIKGLRQLGAEITVERGQVIARANRLRGASVNLLGKRGSTVTGTCNVLSAAVLAEGDTWIEGAACEPEVVDVGRFLRALGARIDGLGTSRIHVRGLPCLKGTTYRIIPDRIEAATFMIAAALTGGEVQMTNVRRGQLVAVIAKLRQIGLTIEGDHTTLSVRADRSLRAADIEALPYPGIPTDLQAHLTALLAIAPGTSHIRDQVFPERFQHVAELRRMGARIGVNGNSAVVRGVPSLVGAQVTATDLRASAALVIAGLAAHGQTTVRQIHHLDRGYERLDEKLKALGAEVARAVDELPIERLAA